jgi:eukaryotic-like serine/threonine-protein kinase
MVAAPAMCPADRNLPAPDGAPGLETGESCRSIPAAMLSGDPRPDGERDGACGDGDDSPPTVATRALAPATDVAAPTRTSTGNSDDSAGRPPQEPRAPAPLQYRDPARYQIMREHGRGGLGRVLRAHDTELRRDVAVKELLRRGTTSELRFFREAMITARLEHPGIVPVHEAGRWPDGTPFYAMKLVHGRPLGELIAGCKTLADRLALIPHVVAIADAIAYAHDRRIIHRDLKPSNVIVGAFGETVVIDWGLAKDLTAEIADPVEDGPYRTPPGAGLTVAGSVLGTPAYMAPEQRQGEADERSDVYAIGGILYHVLAGEPPHRDRDPAPTASPGIPRTGPRDLAAIIARAMQADPDARYPSASALADDLRRFVQRRPVTARRYSLTGRAVLGMARHRAVSVVLIAAFAGLSLVLALANARIGNERERAVRSERVAQAERDRSRRALDGLTLQHAESLLATDPSEALDVIDTYEGPDHLAARRIRASARGMGVARLRAQVAHAAIPWAQGVAGTTYALDLFGQLTATSQDGTTETAATDGAPRRTFAFSDHRALLAYLCNAHDACLFDLARRAPIDTGAALRGLSPAALAFSPDGRRLAALAEGGDVSVWDLSAPSSPALVRRTTVENAADVAFAGSDTLVVAGSQELTVVGPRTRQSRRFAGGISAWAVAPFAPAVAVATTGGAVTIVDPGAVQHGARLTPCAGAVAQLSWLPHRAVLGVACQDGTVATWDARAGALARRGHLDGSPDAVATSFDGTLLIVGSSTGMVFVFDAATDLVTIDRGHHTRITSVAGPTPDWPLITTTDLDGRLRSWLPPQRVARALAVADPLPGSIALGGSPPAIIATRGDAVLRVSPSGVVDTYRPHVRGANFLMASTDRRRLALFGYSGQIELWDVDPLRRRRVLRSPHGTITGGGFVDGTDVLVTAGTDGSVLAWTDAPEPRVVLRLVRPIDAMMVLSSSGVLVIAMADGSLMTADLEGHTRSVIAPGARFSTLDHSPDDRYVVTGDERGVVRLIDAASGATRPVLHANAAIWDIQLSPSGDLFVVATRNHQLYVGRPGRPGWRDLAWSEHAIQANYLRFSPQGDLLLAPGPDGIWVYAPRTDREYRLHLPSTDLEMTRVALDGSGAAVLDLSGQLLWIDLPRLRAAMPSFSK